MPRKKTSFPQRRQRELAWLLYITEGYIANAEHALAVNCVTFDGDDGAVVQRLIDSAAASAAQLRQHLNNIPKEA